MYIASSILSSTVFLYQPGANGNAQQIYELTFILWTLSLGCEEKDLASFLSAGAIRVLFDLICAAPTRKVSCDESKIFINQNQRVILTSLQLDFYVTDPYTQLIVYPIFVSVNLSIFPSDMSYLLSFPLIYYL